ncbi:hypothetical protein SAMN04488074_12734 [Lentzea albidocapillata subsp. violacea]|uniref:DinB superfamily protein n=1 Tax=Lentzea albidocapillata subsp. violacea TaxID=128104 RepID=A0A1G9W7U0_9PSEU|nr:hypothetical protein [Lentzea albidocapillata]SDM80592.1 hypothetical protein SAMN04488074_12734 [Lentzea albidocapillata subsp. violacea]
MDTTALRSAYKKFLDVATTPGLGEAADGGWNADQVLAHVLSVDAAAAAVALGVVSGARPTFDNRICLDRWNLDRIIAEHSGRAGLITHVRHQAAVLCDIADQLSEQTAAVLVPSFLMSGDELVLDQPLALADLVNGLAEKHVPGHTRQLADLRP